MELRHIRCFVAVAEELHFGRAAERLRMAQPPLSQHIQRLEEELGVRLFDRSTRRVTLTRPGEAFLHRARQVLEATDRATNEARRVDRGELGALAIGYMSSATLPTITELLKRFHHEYPHVLLDCVQMNVSEQFHAVAEGRIDAGFVDTFNSSGVFNLQDVTLHAAPLWRRKLVAVVPRAHPLASRATIGVAELANDPFVIMARHPAAGLHDCVIQLCRNAGFSPGVRQEVEQLPVVLTMVAVGLGVALVPASVIRPDHPHLAFIPLEDTAYLDIAMIWRPDSRSPITDTFVAAARGAIPA